MTLVLSAAFVIVYETIHNAGIMGSIGIDILATAIVLLISLVGSLTVDYLAKIHSCLSTKNL